MSGLALGKGVYVCKTLPQAKSALTKIMSKRVHKDAGNEVVVEEFLDGQEISIHAFCDGKTSLRFPRSFNFNQNKNQPVTRLKNHLHSE